MPHFKGKTCLHSSLLNQWDLMGLYIFHPIAYLCLGASNIMINMTHKKTWNFRKLTGAFQQQPDLLYFSTALVKCLHGKCIHNYILHWFIWMYTLPNTFCTGPPTHTSNSHSACMKSGNAYKMETHNVFIINIGIL